MNEVRSDLRYVSGLILAMILLSSVLLPQTVFGARNCEPNKVCIMTGDQMRYYVEFLRFNGTTDLVFGNFINSDNVLVEISNISDGKTTKSREILNLKNNTFTASDGSHRFFMFMAPVPLPNNITETMSEQRKTFKGFDRTVYVNHYENATQYMDFVIDKETGLILNIDFSNTGNFFGESATMRYVYKLLDTNIFDQSGKKSTQSNKIVQNKMIPKENKDVKKTESKETNSKNSKAMKPTSDKTKTDVKKDTKKDIKKKEMKSTKTKQKSLPKAK